MTIFEYRGLKFDSNDVIVDDMPNEIFREIFDFCGADTALSLLKHMNGNTIQVPTRGFINLEKRYICADYDGTTASIRKIARKHNITEGYIREVLKSNRIPAPVIGQQGLFGE